MKTITRYMVVTQVLEVTLKVEDEWKEGDEELASSIITSKMVEGSQMSVARFFGSDEDAAEFQQGEVGRL